MKMRFIKCDGIDDDFAVGALHKKLVKLFGKK